MKIKSILKLSGFAIALGVIAWGASLLAREPNSSQAAPEPKVTTGFPVFSPLAPQGDHASSTKGDILLQSYLHAKLPGPLARRLLDELYATSNFARTRGNFDALRQALRTSKSSEERVGLARVLSTFYSRGDSHGLNKEVRAALLEAKASHDLSYLSASVLAYTRLDYFDDSESFLAYAWGKRAIDDDGYFGELAHLLNLAPPAGRASILQTLQQGNNPYARDILTAQLTQGSVVAELPAHESRILEKMLTDCEPVLPGEKHQIGLISSFQYSAWLKALATLGAAGDPAKYERAILARIAAPESDPRTAVAFLSNPESDSFILSQHRTPAYAKLLARIDAYATEPGNSSTVLDRVREVHHRTEMLSR
ncbi:MAG: hypothetical protein IPN40_16780 [Uliginosibacterium sp.]|nr:hypothetical protein [Uliginosibacterium sp.]